MYKFAILFRNFLHQISLPHQECFSINNIFILHMRHVMLKRRIPTLSNKESLIEKYPCSLLRCVMMPKKHTSQQPNYKKAFCNNLERKRFFSPLFPTPSPTPLKDSISKQRTALLLSKEYNLFCITSLTCIITFWQKIV